MFTKRRSVISNRVTDVIPEDDDSLVPSNSDTSSKAALQENRPLNIMSSTINESTISRSTLLDEIDKENLHSPESIVRSPTKRPRRNAAHVDDDETDAAQPSPALAARLDAIEGDLRDLSWFVHFKLLTLGDTHLPMIKDGIAEVNDTVSKLARSDQFIRRFEALKEENAMLRAELRAKNGETADNGVVKTMGLLL